METNITNERIVATLSKGLIEPKISVVGCGGAGNNVVHSIYWSNKNVDTIAINTDESKLEKIDAHKKILIGKDVTHGQGAGGFPEVGEYCAECAKDAIASVLKGRDIIFIVAGMGGGTGTGAAPVVAKISKDLNAVTFIIAINPFSHEVDRYELAKEGVKKLRAVQPSTIVLENDGLLDIAGDVTFNESFSIMERSIGKIIDSVRSKITESFISSIREDVEEMMAERENDTSNISVNVPMAPVEEVMVASDMRSAAPAAMAMTATVEPQGAPFVTSLNAELITR